LSNFEELAASDDRIVAVTNDSLGSASWRFQKRFPERLINVGIAEQDMIGGRGLTAEAAVRLRRVVLPHGSGPAEQIKADLAYFAREREDLWDEQWLAYGRSARPTMRLKTWPGQE
jgi:transketolase